MNSPAPDLSLILAELRKMNAQQARSLSSVQTVTFEEAQEILGCSRSRVFELVKEGRLKTATKVGKQRRILLESIQQLQAGGVRVGARPPKPKPVPEASVDMATRIRNIKLPF